MVIIRAWALTVQRTNYNSFFWLFLWQISCFYWVHNHSLKSWKFCTHIRSGEIHAFHGFCTRGLQNMPEKHTLNWNLVHMYTHVTSHNVQKHLWDLWLFSTIFAVIQTSMVQSGPGINAVWRYLIKLQFLHFNPLIRAVWSEPPTTYRLIWSATNYLCATVVATSSGNRKCHV